MADKTPIPESRLQGVISKKKKADQTRDMNPDLPTHEYQSHEPEAKDIQSQDTQNHDTRLVNRELDNRDSGNVNHDSGKSSVDPKILEWAIAKGCEDPRISGYSEFAMSVLRYLRKTTPEFSMSGAASSLLEEALREKYPELSARVAEEIEKRS